MRSFSKKKPRGPLIGAREGASVIVVVGNIGVVSRRGPRRVLARERESGGPPGCREREREREREVGVSGVGLSARVVSRRENGRATIRATSRGLSLVVAHGLEDGDEGDGGGVDREEHGRVEERLHPFARDTRHEQLHDQDRERLRLHVQTRRGSICRSL